MPRDRYRGRPLIEDRDAQARLARDRGAYWYPKCSAWRALWAGARRSPIPAFGPMAKMFSSEKFLTDSADLLNLTAPYLAVEARRARPPSSTSAIVMRMARRIYGGTSEVHRSMIAERNLGLPRTRA